MLQRFRQASMLAVVMTSLLLLIADPEGAAAQGAAPLGAAAEQGAAEPESENEAAVLAPEGPEKAEQVAEATTEEAARVFDDITQAIIANLPKFALVLALLASAWLLVRVLRLVLRRTLGKWPRADAVVALSVVAIWIFAIGVSVTIIAGDVRAFLGSVGLLGLAASWALQTPIESFTGWLLNAFRGYYRVGDRIEVGEILGEVYRIDVLNTTLWEIGSPFRPGFISAEQPTGRLITFPNNQILTGSVVNYTRDFPYVWDELAVAIANESDLAYAMQVIQRAASGLLGSDMEAPAAQYEVILQRAGLEDVIPREPQVFASLEDAWTNLQVRYLVHTRRRRKAKTDLILTLNREMNRPEHAGRIIGVVPRQQLQLVGTDGMPKDATFFAPPRTDVESGE